MSKSKSPRPTQQKATAQKSKSSGIGSSIASAGISAGLNALGIGGRSGKKGSGKKHRKKTAMWYAKEIQRVKLKKKYEKVKIGAYR